MSRYYSNYQQYLGSQRCCDLRGPGPQGPIGPVGPASIGPPGTGFTGDNGPTGPTGRSCRGPTGPTVWDPSGAFAIQYTGDVYIDGNLNVTNSIEGLNTLEYIDGGFVKITGVSGSTSVAIGGNGAGTGHSYQQIAIGDRAGQTGQGLSTVSIGSSAGQTNQGSEAIALGTQAGLTTQAQGAVAVGFDAGRNNQGTRALSIGYQAGMGTTSGQGSNSIAIGNQAGVSSQVANSICLNASGSALNPNQAGLFVRPIRGVALGIGVNRLSYDPATFEIVYSLT